MAEGIKSQACALPCAMRSVKEVTGTALRSEGRHHRLGVTRLKPMQRAKQNGGRDKEPSMRAALRNEVGEGGHGNGSQIGRPPSSSWSDPAQAHAARQAEWRKG